MKLDLIYYNPEKQTLYTKRKAKHRLIDVPSELYQYLLMNRLEPCTHPFFTDRQEFFQAYLADLQTRRNVGIAVGTKMGKQLLEMDDQLTKMKREVDRMEMKTGMLDKVQEILKNNGIRTGYGLEDRLNERLSVGVDRQLKNEISELKYKINRIHEMVEPESKVGV